MGGRKGRVDRHVDGEAGIIAGPSMASRGPCCGTGEASQGGAPAGGGDAGGGREAGGVVSVRLAPEAGLGVVPGASGGA